jgi:ATP-dependent DNA ligase
VTQRGLVGLVANDDWWMSRKMDGKRLLVHVKNGKLTAYNRSGGEIDIPQILREFLRRALKGSEFILDGEMMNGVEKKDVKYFVFDLPMAGNVVGLDTPFAKRLEALGELSKLCEWPASNLVGTLAYAKTTEEKTRMLRRLYAAHAEGVMLRHVNGAYKPGRRVDTLLKGKFYKDCECVVLDTNIDGKSNLSLGVYKNGEMVEIGRCSALTADGPSCVVGSIVTVTYLYLGPHGRLVQPTSPKLRGDKEAVECDYSQLVPTSKALTLEDVC